MFVFVACIGNGRLEKWHMYGTNIALNEGKVQ